MKIGELSRATGLTPSRIRFYEAAGLLTAVERQANGYREYASDAIKVLEIIASAQKNGFSLAEIKPLLPQPNTVKWKHDDLLRALRGKLVEIEAMQKRLAQNRKQVIDIIKSIEGRPEDLPCAEGLELVMSKIRRGASPVNKSTSVKPSG